MEKCPCGSQKSYNECCEPLVTWKTDASTPEQLMRARYSAYAKEKIDFILNTTIEEKRKECTSGQSETGHQNLYGINWKFLVLKTEYPRIVKVSLSSSPIILREEFAKIFMRRHFLRK